MAGGKFKRNVKVTHGSLISVTLTIARLKSLVPQMLEVLYYLKRYSRAYNCLHLTLELGEGRLHVHYVGMVVNLLKHKAFMHNWQALYGRVFIDTWDGLPDYISGYLCKEMLLRRMAPNWLGENYLKNAYEISQYIKCYKTYNYYIQKEIEYGKVRLASQFDMSNFFKDRVVRYVVHGT